MSLYMLKSLRELRDVKETVFLLYKIYIFITIYNTISDETKSPENIQLSNEAQYIKMFLTSKFLPR